MAVSENTTIAPAVQRTSPPGPAITNIDPAGLPDHYGVRVSGNCMLPEIADEDLLRFDKREPVRRAISSISSSGRNSSRPASTAPR